MINYFIGFCFIFICKGFIDWKLCNIFLFICLNIFYFFNEVYKCKFIVVYFDNDNVFCNFFVILFKLMIFIF